MYLNQTKYSYTPKELKTCLKHNDFWRFEKKLNKNGAEKIASLASKYFHSNGKILEDIDRTTLKGNPVFTTQSLEGALCFRRTDDILRKVLRLKPANRNNEVKQFIEVLQTEAYGNVLRTDIKSFFESTQLSEVISKLENNGFLNPACIKFIKDLNKKLRTKFNYDGLPRGLSFSSTLAEFVLKEFDQKIKNIPTVIFYSRFVDDISVVYADQNLDIINKIRENLPHNLKLNSKKTESEKISTGDEVNYLGYCIGFGNNSYVKISKSKIDRAKKRIDLSLKKFVENNDFGLLKDRINFLSTNSILDKPGRGQSICSGFRYDYNLCDDQKILNQLKKLDTFLFSIVYSQRYWLGRELRKKLSKTQLKELKKISFHGGYKHKITYKVDRERVGKLKMAWKYE